MKNNFIICLSFFIYAFLPIPSICNANNLEYLEKNCLSNNVNLNIIKDSDLAPIRLIFVGDIMVHARQLDIAKSGHSYDFLPSFQHIKYFLKGDAVIGNFETVLGGPDKGYTGYPRFNTPDELARDLHRAGFTALMLANNHTFDQGTSGALRTVQTLKHYGLMVTGVEAEKSKPIILNFDNTCIGIFNYTYGSNVPISSEMSKHANLNIIDIESISNDILYLRQNGARFIIAYLHWGEEYNPNPNQAQKDLAEVCLALGVDAIIGTHPHILQPIDIYNVKGKARLVAWSLGNFISSQRTVPRERSVVLALDLLPSPNGPSLIWVGVVPTWVELNSSKKIVRILPAVPKFEKFDDDFLKRKLISINQHIINFLKLPPYPVLLFDRLPGNL